MCGFREAVKIHLLGFMQSMPLAMSRRATGLEIPAPTNFISSRQHDYPQCISHECTEIHLKLPSDTPDCVSYSYCRLSIFYKLEAACTSLLT